jgi:Rps23 Pro-64 3,4-dihydroxylase Tpa1-like proline 4-hydroxylase
MPQVMNILGRSSSLSARRGLFRSGHDEEQSAGIEWTPPARCSATGERQGTGPEQMPKEIRACTVLDDFLPHDLADAFLDWTIAEQNNFRAATIGSQDRMDSGIRNARTHAGGQIPHAQVLRATLTRRLPDILAGIGMEPFPVAAFESTLIAYGDGAHYQRHIDTFIAADRANRTSDRVVSLVYFMNRGPGSFSGGELAIYPVAGATPAQLIEPRHNRLAAFASFMPHEVRPVICPSGDFSRSRFSLAAWLKKASR